MKKFNQIYQNIILELINPGMQAQFHFPKLSKLGFKVFFTNHAAEHDADRNVTQGNDEWIHNLIDEQISKLIISGKYNKNTVFSLFTKYYDLIQIPIRVDFNLKKITLLTIISTLSQQRFNRLSSLPYFKDSKGIINIPIKC